MKKVEHITESEEENLKAFKKHHLKLEDIFDISERVVYTWIDNFNENEIIGLLTKKVQGKGLIPRRVRSRKTLLL